MNTHGRGRFVVVVAAVAAISAAGGTDVLASACCTAANSGSLNADLSAGASVTREVALDAGDTLGITASDASATLVSGAGAPLTLIAVGGATAACAPRKSTLSRCGFPPEPTAPRRSASPAPRRSLRPQMRPFSRAATTS
jgi:hypothetical protein